MLQKPMRSSARNSRTDSSAQLLCLTSMTSGYPPNFC